MYNYLRQGKKSEIIQVYDSKTELKTTTWKKESEKEKVSATVTNEDEEKDDDEENPEEAHEKWTR